MRYAKPPLTIEQQADLLLRRGMSGDRELIKERLSSVSYYRLSAYCYPFRNKDDSFRLGTSFDTVWQHYVFDRRLRLITIDAIERIEIAIRSWLAYHHAHKFSDAFAYADPPKTLPGLNPEKRQQFLSRLATEAIRNKELFVSHFREKYGDEHSYLPIWMATEIMTFGSILDLFRGCDQSVRQRVSQNLAVHDTVVESWLLALNTIRNICAHHGRLWNRVLGIKPKIPERLPDWHSPIPVTNDRVFGILTVCRYCLCKIAPQSNWANRLQMLLAEYQTIPIKHMGFPDDWRKCPIWA